MAAGLPASVTSQPQAGLVVLEHLDLGAPGAAASPFLPGDPGEIIGGVGIILRQLEVIDMHVTFHIPDLFDFFWNLQNCLPPV